MKPYASAKRAANKASSKSAVEGKEKSEKAVPDFLKKKKKKKA